jgi:hypothetical protein
MTRRLRLKAPNGLVTIREEGKTKTMRQPICTPDQLRIQAWLRQKPAEEDLRRNPNDLRQKRLKLTKAEREERIAQQGAMIRRLRMARRSRLADWNALDHAEIAIAGMYNGKFYEPTPYMAGLLKARTPGDCERVQWNGEMVEEGTTAGNFFDRAS